MSDYQLTVCQSEMHRGEANMLAMRWFLLLTSVLFAKSALCDPIVPITCAIRWDAWYTNGPNDPGHYTAAALAKPEWRARVPLHAFADQNGKLSYAPSQRTFDAEIHAAKQADLCWAYLTYGRDHKIDLDVPMMRGLKYHRSSEMKSEVPYALILQAGTLGQTDDYRDAVAEVVSLMHDENYQKVTIDGQTRPLLLFFYEEGSFRSLFGNSMQTLKAPFDLIRESAREQELGVPYIVILAWSADQAETIRKSIGADAISRYSAGKRAGSIMRWADYEATFEPEWNNYAAATSAAVVPTLSTGGDIRARCETPPPWDHNRFPPGGHCDNYTINPSEEELRAEFRDALGWLKRHSEKDPANLLLVYSWSECDESGNCLMPTYGDPTGEKVRAIGNVLRAGR